jgi:hypothetical protein
MLQPCACTLLGVRVARESLTAASYLMTLSARRFCSDAGVRSQQMHVVHNISISMLNFTQCLHIVPSLGNNIAGIQFQASVQASDVSVAGYA